MLMLGQASGPFPPMQGSIYLYVEDCDAVYAKALDAGGTSAVDVTTLRWHLSLCPQRGISGCSQSARLSPRELGSLPHRPVHPWSEPVGLGVAGARLRLGP